MRCARCQDPLQEERYESVRLLACPQGHGGLVTREARRTLTVAARASLEHAMESPREGDLRCAMCQRPSARVVAHRHGDAIELDACLACGAVWFDAGEVARLQQVPAARGEAPARVRGAKALAGGTDGMYAGFVAVEGIGSLIGALLDGW